MERKYKVCFSLSKEGKKFRVIDLRGLLENEKERIKKTHAPINVPTVYLDETGYVQNNAIFFNNKTTVEQMFDCTDYSIQSVLQ